MSKHKTDVLRGKYEGMERSLTHKSRSLETGTIETANARNRLSTMSGYLHKRMLKKGATPRPTLAEHRKTTAEYSKE
jgi:hypothetical protein